MIKLKKLHELGSASMDDTTDYSGMFSKTDRQRFTEFKKKLVTRLYTDLKKDKTNAIYIRKLIADIKANKI